MPVIDEHEPAFSERPFRTQATNAPRGSGCERHFSSMLWRQRRLERLPSSILHFRGGAEGTSRAFRGSGTDSSGTCRAFFGSGARSGVHFEPAAGLGQARAAISRASCGSGPGSSGHFEPAAAAGQARAAVSSQLRLRAKLDTAFLANSGISRGKASVGRRRRNFRAGRAGQAGQVPWVISSGTLRIDILLRTHAYHAWSMFVSVLSATSIRGPAQ